MATYTKLLTTIDLKGSFVCCACQERNPRGGEACSRCKVLRDLSAEAKALESKNKAIAEAAEVASVRFTNKLFCINQAKLKEAIRYEFAVTGMVNVRLQTSEEQVLLHICKGSILLFYLSG